MDSKRQMFITDLRFTFGTNGMRAQMQGFVTPTYTLRAGLISWLAGSCPCRLSIINGNTGWIGRHMVTVKEGKIALEGKAQFDLGDVFRRFVLLEQALESDNPPPPDFKTRYMSRRESLDAWNYGHDTKQIQECYDDWAQRNEGDYECGRCAYRDFCLNQLKK